MTIRPGPYCPDIMNGDIGDTQAPSGTASEIEERRAFAHVPQSASPKAHANGLKMSSEQSKLESQRIVNEMVAQERQAYAQQGQAVAASSTAPGNVTLDRPPVLHRAGMKQGGGGNGNSGRGLESLEQRERGGIAVDAAELRARQELVNLIEELKG